MTNSAFSQLIPLLAISVLLHELLSICNRGPDYIIQCVAPVLGLKLRPVVHSIMHVLLIIVAALLSVTADLRLLIPLFVLLTLMLASYSIRLPNHLVVAWFCFLTLTLDLLKHAEITEMSELGICSLVVLTYGLAVLHKLNHDYFNPKSSCAVQLFRFYFEGDLPAFWTRRFVVVAVIWGPVIAEAAIPLLLLFNRTRVVGVLAAICLQTLFGFARNAPFSTVMYAGLTMFLKPTTLSGGTVLIAFAVGALLAFRFSMWKAYPIRKVALVLHAIFGGLSVYLLLLVITAGGLSPNGIHPERLDWIVVAALLVLFGANALSPYYSSKTEFSLAMFSNLRPDRWSHFVVSEPHRQECGKDYVEIVRIHGLPQLTDFPRASMSYRLVRTFTPYEGRKYLKYYLVESLRNLQSRLASDFFVEIADGDQFFRISSSADLSKLKHRKLCLTPIVMPSDPRAPYCN